MRCPYCGNEDTKVIDSRPSEDRAEIRRRRVCEKCERRFTTYERIETVPLMVIKKDNAREVFDRDKHTCVLLAINRGGKFRQLCLQEFNINPVLSPIGLQQTDGFVDVVQLLNRLIDGVDSILKAVKLIRNILHIGAIDFTAKNLLEFSTQQGDILLAVCYAGFRFVKH